MAQHDKETGFTLIETLVAFAIVALLLLPLLRSFSTGVASTSRTDAVDAATLVAQSTLESMVPDAEAARMADIERQNGPYRIAGRIRAYAGEGVPNGPGVFLLPYEISVTVSWQDGPRTRSVALDTLRLGPAPNQEQGP